MARLIVVIALLLRLVSLAPDVDELDCKPLALIVGYDDEADVTDYAINVCLGW